MTCTPDPTTTFEAQIPILCDFFDNSQSEIVSTSLIHLFAIVYFPRTLSDYLKIMKIPDNFFRN
jgi:hypothetical protein